MIQFASRYVYKKNLVAEKGLKIGNENIRNGVMFEKQYKNFKGTFRNNNKCFIENLSKIYTTLIKNILSYCEL